MTNFENIIIPFQINNFIKGSILRLGSVTNDIIDQTFPNKIKSIFADTIVITALLGSRTKNNSTLVCN